MADPISDIVDISITSVSSFPTQAGFGRPLFLSYHTVFPELYRIYTDLSEMLADGFTSTHEAYRWAVTLLAQNPNVEDFAIGRKTAADTFVTQVTVTSAVEGQHVRFKVLEPVTGTVSQIDYTIGAAATTTTVATAIELLTEALTGVDSTSSGAVVSITPTVAGRKVHVYDMENATVAETTADADYDDELSALQLVFDDFYGVAIASQSSANIAKVAAWALASESPKLFVAAVSNTTSASTALDSSTAIGDALEATTNDRTSLWFAWDSDDRLDAAVLGMGLTSNPGSITWHNQVLAGVTARPLTTNQRTALAGSHINYFIPIRGRNVTQGGFVSTGEYIDIIHGLDALKEDIQVNLFNALSGRDKVPFTLPGFTLIENSIMGSLRRFEPSDANGTGSLLVFKSSAVKMPDLATVSDADKAARRLRGVKFSATLAGAVHSVQVVGQVNL